MKVVRGGATAVTVFAVLGTALLLGGCAGDGRDKLAPRQVAGVWEGSGGGRVEFQSDGSFRMSGIPRGAIEFGFSKPPPGNGRLSGRGNWELEGDTRRSDSIELRFAAGGSFRDDSESTLLQVAKGGDHPSLYFDTNSDKGYGYEVRRTG
ncbi:hypothetical protein [Streptomyces echinatus]|uniref:Lipoprotein n=1 Tax=Streptomyces echinatus TaxID=67293 RepID=A0A7W9Q1V7_9ACTN|nr:hypothetical protein [Streptomyces echinatus]MBB5932020.1 hypothetical protein [Streptomyces echinatus]